MSLTVFTLLAVVMLLAALMITTRIAAGSGLAVPPHQTSTRQMEIMFPFHANSGLGAGSYIGVDRFSGAMFCLDLFALAARGVVDNTNMAVFGMVGSGKSAFVKILILRAWIAGRRSVILDPKGEYHKLAKRVSGTHVLLRPGGDTVVNPLDVGDGTTEGRARVAQILRALVESVDNRSTTSLERQAIMAGYTEACLATGVYNPLLSDIAAAMLDPSEVQAKSLAATRAEVAEQGRAAASALNELCTNGALAGMFDGPTNIEVDWSAPVVVIDMKGTDGNAQARGVLLAVAMAWVHPILAAKTGKRLFVLDEFWAALQIPSMTDMVNSMMRLSREYGVSTLFVSHHPTDLELGDTDAQQLLNNLSTLVLFNHSDNKEMLARTKRLFDLPDVAIEALPELAKGVCLVKVKDRLYMVDVQLSNEDAVMTESNTAITDGEEVAA